MFSFALPSNNHKSKSTPSASSSSLKRPAAFASADDDDPLDAAPTSSDTNKQRFAGNKAHIAQASGYSKVQKKRMEAEKLVDASVYEYDEVWDKMQEAKQKQRQVKQAESQQRKVWSPHITSCGYLLNYK
jgi:hypothetical protein